MICYMFTYIANDETHDGTRNDEVYTRYRRPYSYVLRTYQSYHALHMYEIVIYGNIYKRDSNT